MNQQPEQEAVRRAVADVGYLHSEFSVEVTTADQIEGGERASRAKIVIVRNKLSKRVAGVLARPRAGLGAGISPRSDSRRVQLMQ